MTDLGDYPKNPTYETHARYGFGNRPMSINKLSKLSGVTTSTLYDFLNNGKTIHSDALGKVLDALQLQITVIPKETPPTITPPQSPPAPPPVKKRPSGGGYTPVTPPPKHNPLADISDDDF